MGLEIDPKHVGINEYMGELFVVTNRMDEAKKKVGCFRKIVIVKNTMNLNK